MHLLFLDTETTGLLGQDPEVLSLALVDGRGRVLLDTLVRPVRHTEWPEAESIHGITPAQVLGPNVPTLAELTPQLLPLLRGAHLVIYNAAFEQGVLGDVLTQARPGRTECAMLAFAEFYGDWHTYYRNYRWQSLSTAAAYVLHEWGGPAHTALADTHATRAVWRYLNRPSVRRRVDTERARRQQLAEQENEVLYYLWELESREQKRREARNQELTRQWFPDLQPRPVLSARASLDVFLREQTGAGLGVWQTYGPLAGLPRYGNGHDPVPAHLVSWGSREGGVCFLGGRREPVAMRVLRLRPLEPGSALCDVELEPLYDLTGLRAGVEYVPFVREWPAGHYSATELKREFKLKPDQVQQLRPVLAKRTRYGVDCLLYAAADVLAAQAA